MIELILQHLPSIVAAISALLGVGLFKGAARLYKTYHTQQRKDDAQHEKQRADTVSEQSKRIDSLLERMKQVEERQEEERRARVEAEIENKRLRAMVGALSGKIDQLVAMVQDLRQEAGMEPLTDSEKADLKETPDFISNGHTQRDDE